MAHVVVLHGALGAADQLLPVAAALREMDGAPHHVEVIELPGHGNTPLAAGSRFSIDTFVRSLSEQLHARLVMRPFVFGYSMGGYVALALEAHSPGTFSGIATLGTKFEWTPEVAEREGARLDATTIRERVPRFADVLATRHERSGGWELVLDSTRALLRELGAAPVLTAALLSPLQLPVRLAVGSRDDTVSIDETKRIADFCHGTAVTLDDVPHPIERVPTAAIVQLVRDLL